MESASELVYVVDDDGRVREALAALLRSSGRDVQTFNSGEEFLDTPHQNVIACLILDMRIPGMSGLEIQKLVSRDSQIPIIFITGRADVPSTVLAMKGGAIDFLTKPLDEDALMRAVDAAIARAHVLRKEAEDTAVLQALHQSLTPREQELLPLLASGRLNKQAAADLGITEYTVQVHRGNIMRKMQADSFATLVRQVSRLQLETSSTRRRTALPVERLFRERS
ncbi:response regulator [Paraburkholderia sp. RL18-103-BIB-C]|jgi:FixJ family two-component response regulator|uniref:response regulator transcription factor n=1 Tax=unclassified Paraburkholderia TaxID=2615204 RepID=UPI0038B6F7DE